MDTLHDYAAQNCHVDVECRRCHRTATFAAAGLADFLRSRNGSASIDQLERRFVCQGHSSRPGCGNRGAIIRPTPIEGKYRPPPPKPRSDPAPAGVDPQQWAAANDDERRRLIKQARG